MKVVKLIVALCLLWTAKPMLAQDTTAYQTDTATAAQAPAKFNPTDVIMHHIKDAHSWHLFARTNKQTGELQPVAVPLPIILYSDGHLDIFMSSAFCDGKKPVSCDNRTYVLHHEKIYLTDNGQLAYNEAGDIISPKPLDFSITKNVAALIFSALLLLFIFIKMANGYKKNGPVPTGLRGFLEPVVLFIKDDVAIPNLGEDHYRKYLPYLLTVFFFIWINNMLGLIPMAANLTGNIAVTFVLAFFTLLITNFSGAKHYWIEKVRTPGVPIVLQPIMTIVELIGIFTKPFALMIRLFANISAGHIIVLSLVSLIFIFQTILISPVSIIFVLFMDVLELLVAALQAYIFTMLTALFIGLAIKEEE